VKKLAGYGHDDHPEGDPEKARLAWSVVAFDDCDECGDLRIELTLEEDGRPGAGLAAHLAPATARRLRSLLSLALKEIGEPVDE
jgi:hypothetical protein